MEFTDKALEPFGEVLLAMNIPSDPSLKTPAVFRVMGELTAHGCLPATGSPRAEIVIDEALTNAMLHGNRLERSKKVHLWLFADEARWGLIVEDEGPGFGPEDVPDPGDLEAMLSDSGRGIRLIDSYVDELLYGAGGKRLMLVRHRQTEPDEAEVEAAAPTPSDEAAPPQAGPVRMTREEDVSVVEVLYDRLSDENVEEVRAALIDAARDARALVVDMHRVRYMSSRVIGVLVALDKDLRKRNGLLVLARPVALVRDIFAAVNLDRLFTFAADLDEARALARGALEP